MDPGARATAGDRGADAEALGFGEAFTDAGESLEGVVELLFAKAALGLQGVPVKRACGEAFEVAARIVSGGEARADDLGVLCDGVR